MDVRTERCEVLVVGSGGAGLRTAIELSKLGKDVLVVGKCAKRDAHTILAAGGINAVLKKPDTWEQHAADTIREGCFINDVRAVEELCKDSHKAISELVSWGVPFARAKGKITQRFFGAAAYQRACFAGDHTGREILNALVDKAVRRKIPFRSGMYIVDLLRSGKRVVGALGLDLKTRKLTAFEAKAVVLATGGHSRIFARSSSRPYENTGDGVFLGRHAGAACQDMEMFQFHPTGMVYPPQAVGMLVTEAVRGEGGILTNAKGERFMKRYSPHMELAARDVVARAIYREIEAGRGTRNGAVYLDISHRPRKYIQERLPTMYEQFKRFAGIDISKEKMEVAPTAHYSMGGLLVDFRTGQTSVPGLFAAGEVTAGLHGANRLGGNSLLELIVFGRMTGQTVAKSISKTRFSARNDSPQRVAGIESFLHSGGADPSAARNQLQELMWSDCGVVRKKTELERALKALPLLPKKFRIESPAELTAALDLRAMVPVSEMVLRSALTRTESRGAHFRADYPRTEKKWEKNIIIRPSGISLRPVSRPSAPVSRALRKPVRNHLLE